MNDKIGKLIVGLLGTMTGIMTLGFVSSIPWANHISSRLTAIETVLKSVQPQLTTLERSLHDLEMRVVRMEVEGEQNP